MLTTFLIVLGLAFAFVVGFIIGQIKADRDYATWLVEAFKDDTRAMLRFWEVRMKGIKLSDRTKKNFEELKTMLIERNGHEKSESKVDTQTGS